MPKLFGLQKPYSIGLFRAIGVCELVNKEAIEGKMTLKDNKYLEIFSFLII